MLSDDNANCKHTHILLSSPEHTVPPKWIKNPKDVECVAGQNIVIDCQAQAHPSPRIWLVPLGSYTLTATTSVHCASSFCVAQCSQAKQQQQLTSGFEIAGGKSDCHIQCLRRPPMARPRAKWSSSSSSKSPRAANRWATTMATSNSNRPITTEPS